MARSATRLAADPRGREFEPKLGHINFVESDHEIISRVILPIPLIQEEQLSVTDEKCSHK